jgi:CD63 antigen
MGCGIAIIKYLVFIFNLVFAIIGATLLVVGVLFKIDINILQLNETASVAPLLLIIVGALIFIISFFGCCGAIKESNCMLMTYASLLIFILALQIGIGIFSFIAIKDDKSLRAEIRNEIKEDFDKYSTSDLARETFDNLQQTIKCCGVDGPEDWSGPIPSSCCKGTPSTCKRADEKLFQTGCAKRSYEKLTQVARSVGYVVFGICIAELIGIMFAFCLTNSIRNQYRRGTYA